MNKELILAIDLGTSLIKSGIYDVSGNCISLAKEHVRDERPAPGVFIQHGEQLMESVINCIKNAGSRIGDRISDISGIVFTGQMAGFMGVGSAWEDITGYSCSLDTRYTPYAQKQMECLGQEFYTVSGTNSPLFSTKYEWFCTEFPQDAKKIRKYMMLTSYVQGVFGAMDIEDAVIDGTLLAWTGLADIRERKWSDSICAKLGIDQNYLPKIVSSDSVVAYLSEDIARRTGLKSGIPLIAGAGDKTAGCVGTNILNKGDMVFEAGSYGGLSCLVDDFRPDRDGRYYDILCGCFEKEMYAHYYMPGSGITLDWFVNTFSDVEKGKTGDIIKELESQAALIPVGCDGLTAIGMLGGTAMPFNADVRGMWTGYTWSHGRAHFYRALLESFTCALSNAIDRLDVMYPGTLSDQIAMIGGGAKSTIWPQMIADATGKSVVIMDRDDTTLWGAALLAARGIGLIDSIYDEAERNIHEVRKFVPDKNKKEIYFELRNKYNKNVNFTCQM